MNHRLLWLGTTTLLALGLKRRRSTVTQSPTVGAGPRFSNDSQATVGDIEKSNVFDNVSPGPIRNQAQPLIPPVSPEIDGEQISPYQPEQPSQYDPHSTIGQVSFLTSSPQSESEWTGLDSIDSVGSPKEVTSTLRNGILWIRHVLLSVIRSRIGYDTEAKVEVKPKRGQGDDTRTANCNLTCFSTIDCSVCLPR